MIMQFPWPPKGLQNVDSALLDRVKAFLPQIEQANRDLEQKMKEEGANSVIIDIDLADKVQSQSSSSNDIALSIQSSEKRSRIVECNDNGINSNETDSITGTTSSIPTAKTSSDSGDRVVELEVNFL